MSYGKVGTNDTWIPKEKGTNEKVLLYNNWLHQHFFSIRTGGWRVYEYDFSEIASKILKKSFRGVLLLLNFSFLTLLHY